MRRSRRGARYSRADHRGIWVVSIPSNDQKDNEDDKLHTMMFSLTSQLVAQDISSWLLHAMLRPDRSIRLVSFPSSAEKVSERPENAFRRVDLQVKEFLETGRRGRYNT